jgi:hypothetical protein
LLYYYINLSGTYGKDSVTFFFLNKNKYYKQLILSEKIFYYFYHKIPDSRHLIKILHKIRNYKIKYEANHFQNQLINLNIVLLNQLLFLLTVLNCLIILFDF